MFITENSLFGLICLKLIALVLSDVCTCLLFTSRHAWSFSFMLKFFDGKVLETRRDNRDNYPYFSMRYIL